MNFHQMAALMMLYIMKLKNLALTCWSIMLLLSVVIHMLVDYVTFFGCHSHVVTSHVGRLCYFFRLPFTCWSTHMLVDSITNFSRHSHICRLLLSVEPHMLVDYFFLSFSLLLFLIISCHFVDNSVS